MGNWVDQAELASFLTLLTRDGRALVELDKDQVRPVEEQTSARKFSEEQALNLASSNSQGAGLISEGRD